MMNRFEIGFKKGAKVQSNKGSKAQSDKGKKVQREKTLSLWTYATLNLNKNIEFLLLLVVDIQKRDETQTFHPFYIGIISL